MGSPARTRPESIAGRYLIESILGEGGSACVYRATDPELGRTVAIKVVRPDRDSARSNERLRREARHAAKLHGINVARVLDAGEDPVSGRYIVMEYVEGSTLGKVLADQGKLEMPRAIALALQACAALAEAHELGIIHRDVKPSNLMLCKGTDGEETLKVADFGIAKAENFDGVSLTESTAILGSPKYMSPEQIREARTVDSRTDIWSLGVVVYQMLTGRLPFEAFTTSGLLARIMADPPVPLRERDPSLPEELEAVVMGCLQKKREDRTATVPELAAQLRPFLGKSAVPGSVERLASAPAVPRVATLAVAAPAAEVAADDAATIDTRATIDSPGAVEARSTIEPSLRELEASPPPAPRSPRRLVSVGLTALALLVATLFVVRAAMRTGAANAQVSAPAPSANAPSATNGATAPIAPEPPPPAASTPASPPPIPAQPPVPSPPSASPVSPMRAQPPRATATAKVDRAAPPTPTTTNSSPGAVPGFVDFGPRR
ncbi:MAG: serine/threonine protein kinase [Deltaproteobacteria bacterium]|nr:serine/threonine protein kinase [Deltaproteobacteria bacterium]